MVYLSLLIAGIASGFLAGLLGIGGGFVVVPVLFLLLPTLGVDPGVVPKVAVATSLAAMVPTTCAAVLAHHRLGNLDIGWVRRLARGVMFPSSLPEVCGKCARTRPMTSRFDPRTDTSHTLPKERGVRASVRAPTPVPPFRCKVCGRCAEGVQGVRFGVRCCDRSLHV